MKDSGPFKIYRNVIDSVSLYWRIYGGMEALLQSPYAHLSIVTSFLCFPLWSDARDPGWYDLPLSSLPDLLGFTLGGYAILLAFGNDKFLMVLCAKDDEDKPSPFMNVNAAFVHFIIVQAIALFIAIIAFSWEAKSGPVAWFGVTIFLYSLLTGVAAAFSILRLGKWYDIFLAKQHKRENMKKEEGQ